MNFFNCLQATAFYTLTPFGIQWLFKNGYDVWGWIASLGEVAGFFVISAAINETKLWNKNK